MSSTWKGKKRYKLSDTFYGIVLQSQVAEKAMEESHLYRAVKNFNFQI